MPIKEQKLNAIENLKLAYQEERDEEAFAYVEQLNGLINQLNPMQKSILYEIEGRLNKRAQNWIAAEEAFLKLCNEGLKRSQPYNQTVALHNLGFIYSQMGEYDKSIEQFRQALRIINSFMDSYQEILSRNYLGQAKTFLQAENIEEAKMYLELASIFAQADEANELQAEADQLLAQLTERVAGE